MYFVFFMDFSRILHKNFALNHSSYESHTIFSRIFKENAVFFTIKMQNIF